MKNGPTDVLAESLVQLGASRDEVPCSGAANNAVFPRPEWRDAVEPFPSPQFQLGVGRAHDIHHRRSRRLPRAGNPRERG